MSLALIRYDGSHLSISEKKFHEWKVEFPGLDVKAEIEKANVWLSRPANKNKNWKTLGGFQGWLKRAHKNSPRVKADNKTKGQLAYMERVSHETREREKAEAAIPRPSAEEVSRICGQLMRSLPTYQREEPKRINYLTCSHEWAKSFYGGGEWCEKCGAFRGQWRAV